MQTNDGSEGGWKRFEALAFVAVIVAGIPIRLSMIGRSVWLDEAWVANASLARSLREMFYYPAWAQSTPPMVTLLLRVSAEVAGPGELALRLVPLVAGVAALILLAATFRRAFPFPLALMATVFCVTNYWAVKYAQQVKQYSTDFLAASLMLYLIWSALEFGFTRRRFVLLVAAGCAGVFLSYTVVFWFPVAVVAFAVEDRRSGAKWWFARALLLCGCLAAAFLVCYGAFIAPNNTANLRQMWEGFVLRPFAPGSWQAWFRNFCQMLVPQNYSASRIVSVLAGVMALLGIVRGILGWVGRDRRAWKVLLVAAAPVATGLAASAAGRFPVLEYSRMILWMLPAATVLIVYSVEPVWNLRAKAFAVHRLRLNRLAAAIGVLAVVSGSYLIRAAEQPGEDGRRAYRVVQVQARAGDYVYVHAGLSEQVKYYGNLFGTLPARVYLGNTNWPCCAINQASRVANPAAKTMREDFDSLVADAAGERIWMVVPSGAPGHWSNVIRDSLDGVPGMMAERGYELQWTEALDMVRVHLFEPATAGGSPPDADGD